MIKVVAALIKNDNKILLARRSTGDINVLFRYVFYLFFSWIYNGDLFKNICFSWYE